MTDTTESTFDFTALSAKHTADGSRKRLRQRRWAEVRLKAYGLIAIGIAVLALAILLFTVVSKALGVTQETYLSLELDIQVTERQATALTDNDPMTRVDLKKPIEQALSDVTGWKMLRRKDPLKPLVAGYEGYELSDIVSADPDLIGEDYHFEVLLSDDVQMYLKGDFGALEDAGSVGEITVTPVEGGDGDAQQVEIQTPTTAFNFARELLRTDRAEEARASQRQADDQKRAWEETLARAEAADNAEDRDRLNKEAESYKTTYDRFQSLTDIAYSQSVERTSVLEARTDDPSILIRFSKGWVKVTEIAPDALKGVVVDAPNSFGTFKEGDWRGYVMASPEDERQIKDRQALWIENWKREDRLVTHTNWRLLTDVDSREAEYAGIWTALVGSFWTMIVTFLLAFPIGVMASIYLEEYAPKTRLTQFIEVNINNLAAVPSIVFGLLGLTILLSGVKLFGVDLFDGLLKAFTDDPRSTPLAGGVVLALMSLPTIIIASRASIKAVPPSIRDAALGLGASKLQTATHHVLPLAMPGILTGSIIAMAQALGETAPLIIIGMNSFVQAPPSDPLEPASVLPSLIYLWNNNPERLFDGKTAGAIVVLLVFLVLMNALAVLLRKRFERRW